MPYMDILPHTFKHNLRHWTFHVTACAAPSFYVAYASRYSSPHAIAAMCYGTVIFIILYALISSSSWFCRIHRSSILSKSIRWGKNLRTSISLLGGLAIILGNLLPPFTHPFLRLLLLPDIFSGMFAIEVTRSLTELAPITDIRYNLSGEPALIQILDQWIGRPPSFFQTLTTVLIEGIIISISLLLISLTIALILKLIAKMKRSSPGKINTAQP